MVEKLIEFETAKIAKTRGFNVVCENYFSEHLTGVQENNQCGFRNWNKEYENSFSRPTQSLLQKWLREIHSLDVETEKYQHNEDGRYYKGRVWGEEFENEGYVTGFDSYEDALEEGLLCALAAIKIKN